jgi:hypothetical protein
MLPLLFVVTLRIDVDAAQTGDEPGRLLEVPL